MPNPMDQLLSKGAGRVHEIRARAHGLVGVFATLAEEHGEAGSLLGRLKADPSRRADLWPTIRAALTVHEQGEQRIVYPALREYAELRALADLHDSQASELSRAISALDAASIDGFPQLLDRLIALVEAHVDEEENQIFPAAIAAIGAVRAKELGKQFEAATELIGHKH